MTYFVKCEPLFEGDDHSGQGFCGQEYDLDLQWTICPHRRIEEGPNSAQPDPPLRWPDAYVYLDESFREVFRTSKPRNVNEALDYFTNVSSWFYGERKPKYIAVRKSGQSKVKLLPFIYNWEEDTWSANNAST